VPTELGFGEVIGGGLRVGLLEPGRGGDLGKRGDGSSGAGGVFGPDDLGIAIFWQNVQLVFAIFGIDRIVKCAVSVLHFDEKIGFPFCFLEQIADAVAAFGDAEIIECADARKGICGEDEGVDKLGTIVGDAVVIARFEVAAGNGDRGLIGEGKKLRGIISQQRSDLRRIVGINVHDIIGNGVPGESKGRGVVGGYKSRREVVGGMCEAGEGHGDVEAAALVVNAECVGAGKIHGNAFVNPKREGSAHAGNEKAVLAGSGEAGEVGFVDILIRRWRIVVADVLAQGEQALKFRRAGLRVDDRERVGRNRHFAEVAEEIADDCFFRVGGEVTFLIHVNRGIEAKRIGGGSELNVRGPEGAIIDDLDGCAVRNGSAELEIKPVADSHIPVQQRGIEGAAFEADVGGGVGLAIDDDLEAGRVGRREVSLLVDPIPIIQRTVLLPGVDEGKFEEVGGKDAEGVVAVSGNAEIGITGIGRGGALKGH